MTAFSVDERLRELALTTRRARAAKGVLDDARRVRDELIEELVEAGVNQAVIAEAAGTTVGTVGNRLHRLRRRANAG